MTHPHPKKHYRAAQKSCCASAAAAKAGKPGLIAAHKDFLAEYGPLLVVVLSAISLRRESRGPHLFFEYDTNHLQLARNDIDYSCYYVIDEKDGEIRARRQEPVRAVE